MSSAGATAATNAVRPYLLDSSVLMRSLRGDSAMAACIASAPYVYVSSVVLGELYLGAYGSPTRPEAAIADVETVEKSIEVLSPDAATSRIYAQAKHDLKALGRSIPDNDLWIAAIAIQYGLTLAARDSHFDWITGRRVEQW
jgi:tRNA(fMet)-specific endonuclease VapC